MENRLTFCPIDIGFDPRVHDMLVEYPAWAGRGPVLLEFTRPNSHHKESRECASRDEAVRLLRRHGYRVRLPAKSGAR